MKHEKPPIVNCPACQVPLNLEADGSIGKHWVGNKKVSEMAPGEKVQPGDMRPCDGIAKPKEEKPEGKAA